MKVRKAVIPAAGLGTRLTSYKGYAKEMLPIVDTPTTNTLFKKQLIVGLKRFLS